MLFDTMRNYYSFMLERGVRLTNIAIEMDRAIVWEADQDIAEQDNLEADQDLIKSSLRLV